MARGRVRALFSYRGELLACKASSTLAEAGVLIEQWRKHYNTVGSYTVLDYPFLAP